MKNKTAVVYHKDYLKHSQGANHPERPDRLEAIMRGLEDSGLIRSLDVLTPAPCSAEDLLRVHPANHVDRVRNVCRKGGGYLDPDTYAAPETYDVALLAAGGVTAAGEKVASGDYTNCFAFVRPPGHHATRSRAMGFCYFNNVAVAVRHIQDELGLRRVAIVDWDAHAPNGTMGTFYEDPTVLNMSIHQDPHSYYPGCGFVDQTGDGAGRGYTVNFPVPAGTGDADYLYLLEEFVVPRVKRFKPDFIAVAAGQDSHVSDLISKLNLTDAGYAAMTQTFMKLANQLCGGKIVFELEGGYNIKTLPKTNHAIASAMLGMKPEKEVEGKVLASTKDLLTQLRNSNH